MKHILVSFMEGIKNVWATKYLIGIMLIFKLVTSLILGVPLYLMFSTSFAANIKASNFLTGFNPSLVIDFVYYWRRTLSIYVFMFILTSILIIIAYIFLSGGFWGVLRDQAKRRVKDTPTVTSGSGTEGFFAACGKYFGGMFKIGLLMIPLYLFAFLIWLIFIAILGMVVGEGSLWVLTSWRTISKILIALILYFCCNMLGDYLRIFMLEKEDDHIWVVIRKAFRFVWTNLSSTLCLYYLLSIILVGVILFYGGMYKLVSGISPTGIFIFIAFLLQQLFVVFHSFYRLIFYSSQMSLYVRISDRDDHPGEDLDFKMEMRGE